MKAIVSTKYGSADYMKLQDVAKPIPKDNEVLIKVHAATVTIGDVILRKMGLPLSLLMPVLGFPRKPIPGHEFAGEVEAVGKDVTLFKVGDQVFGTTTGLTVGANAEYVCLPEVGKKGVMELKPVNLPYEEAAAIPIGGMTALQLLRRAKIQPGQKVLIYGASGSVGTYAVQLAKYWGAEVTGICSTSNLEMVRTIGADRVIDYTQEDVTKIGETYDVIFDAVGKAPSALKRNALKTNGVYLSVKSSTSEESDYLLYLKDLADSGKIKPVIDRCFPLSETANAHRYVETKRKKGNVVISVA